nr:hypothetical protein [Lentzea jiangxiensis]
MVVTGRPRLDDPQPVWSRTDFSVERADGGDVLVDPGEAGLPAIMRSCGVVIARSSTRPPGASTRSSIEKQSGQCPAPTASIISTLTTASYRPCSSQ